MDIRVSLLYLTEGGLSYEWRAAYWPVNWWMTATECFLSWFFFFLKEGDVWVILWSSECLINFPKMWIYSAQSIKANDQIGPLYPTSLLALGSCLVEEGAVNLLPSEASLVILACSQSQSPGHFLACPCHPCFWPRPKPNDLHRGGCSRQGRTVGESDPMKQSRQFWDSQLSATWCLISFPGHQIAVK